MTSTTAIDGPLDASSSRFEKIRSALGERSIVLVGMMGAGKSSIGRRLASELSLPFFDADSEIERAAGMTIEDMFKHHGEASFREGEERVIRRLLNGGPQILATGGGAVLSAQTRDSIAKKGVSVWLNAPLELLMQRVSRRDNRPLLKTSNPKDVMKRLMEQREPYYSKSNIVFESRDAPHEHVVQELLTALEIYFVKENETGTVIRSDFVQIQGHRGSDVGA